MCLVGIWVLVPSVSCIPITDATTITHREHAKKPQCNGNATSPISTAIPEEGLK